jgi:hypothetical protein
MGRKQLAFTDMATLPLDAGGCAPVLDAPPPLAEPVTATFNRIPVTVTAIGAERVTVKHHRRLEPEGDLTLRIPGLFPELSRVEGRVVRLSRHESFIEITKNPLYLKFAVDALRTPKLPIKKKEEDIEEFFALLPPPEDRDVPSLIPIVRLRERRVSEKPVGIFQRLVRKWNAGFSRQPRRL